MYIGEKDPSDPPLNGNWEGLPPIFVQAAKEEILLSDSLRLVDEVKKAKGPIILEIWQNRFHTWSTAASLLPEAKDALAHVKIFVEDNEGLLS